MADIVDDFLQRLAQHIPDAPLDVRVKIESSIRQTWGGTEPYVRQRLSRSTSTMLVAHGLRKKQPLPEVFAMAGVRRSTGYEILKRK